MKFIKLFIILFAFSPLVFAQQTIQSDSVKLGRPNTNNKSMIFEINQGAANPRIRANGSTQKLQFTNDGTNYKDIGSGAGGGGGINALQDFNFDFETGTANWTNSGGTFTTSNTPALNGAASGLWSSSASGQTLRSALVPVSAAFVGRSCQVDGLYRFPSGNAGSLIWEVVDGSNNVLAQTEVLATTGSEVRPINFPQFTCPTSGTFRFGVRSTGASGITLRIDDIFLGAGRNSVQISQATYYGKATVAGTALCSWGPITNANFTSFAADSDCPVATTTGSVSSPATRIPAVTFSGGPGVYKIIAYGNLLVSGANQSIRGFRFFDGTTGFGASWNQGGAPTNNSGVLTATVEYATSFSNRTIEIQCQANSSDSCSIPNNDSKYPFTIEVYKFPTQAAEAVTLETSGWFFEGNIGSSIQNLAIGTGTIASQSEMTDSTLDLALRSGSANGQIACSGTNPSTGLTCSAGNESVGFQTTVPTAGQYEVCFVTNTDKRITASANLSFLTTQFNIVRTPNNAQTFLDTSLATAYQSCRQVTTTGAAAICVNQIYLCAPFNIETAGPVTFRMMASQGLSGSAADVNTNVLYTNRTNSGYVAVRMRKLNEQQPTPVFTDLQNSLRNRIANSDAGQTVVYGATIDNTGSTCPVARSFGGNWISGTTWVSAGVCNINFASGFFNGTDSLTCTATPTTVSAVGEARVSGMSPTSMQVVVANSSGTGTNASFSVICIGRK